MKKIVFLVICIVVPMMCAAQYYNPYGSYQQQQQMNQKAYEWGKKLVEQEREKYEKQLKQNPSMMRGVAVSEMANGQYSKAYERFEYLAENYDETYSWQIVGYMNELGMGTTKSYSYAKTCYSNGAELGDQNCKIELQRIKQGKYLGSDFKAILRSHFQNIVAMSIQSVNSIDWGLSSGSNSSGSSSQRQSDYGYVNCPHCHGTGVCSVCNNKGYQDSPYTGGVMRCSSCQGIKHCMFCSGKGTRYQRVR